MDKPTKEQLAERRAAWVKALRSEKYKQGRSSLTRVICDDDEDLMDLDCCLGVGCKLAIESGLKVKVQRPNPDDDDDEIERQVRYDGIDDFMPDSVRQFYGLKTNSGEFGTQDEDGDYNSLAKMNDGGANFHKIADFIESNPPGLFVEDER